MITSCLRFCCVKAKSHNQSQLTCFNHLSLFYKFISHTTAQNIKGFFFFFLLIILIECCICAWYYDEYFTCSISLASRHSSRDDDDDSYFIEKGIEKIWSSERLSSFYVSKDTTTDQSCLRVSPQVHILCISYKLASRKSSGEGNGNPLRYFRLENPMDEGAW